MRLWKHLWPLRIGPHIVLMITGAVALTAGLGWLFGIRLPTAADQASKPFEGIKLVLAVVAGIGGVVALTVAYRKQKLGETTERRLEAADAHSRALSDSSEAREQSKHFHERFAAATEQLGSNNADIRTAGVYALAHLADDWDAGRQTCINVLCNYIRKPYTPPEKPGTSATPETAEQMETRQQHQVRHTIFEILGERLRSKPIPGKTWHGHVYNFSSATIDGGDLHGAQFTGGLINFRGAKFSGGLSNFQAVRFSGGYLDFRDVEFSGGIVDFRRARFSSGYLDFRRARLSNGYLNFDNAEFSGGSAYFQGTKFTGGNTYFRGVEFSGTNVHFETSKFTGASIHFETSKFSGARVHFEHAKFTSGSVDFRHVKFTGGEVKFQWMEDWSCPPVFDDFPDGPPKHLVLPAR